MIIAEQHKPTKPEDRRKGADARTRKGAGKAGGADHQPDETIVEANQRTREEEAAPSRER